MIKQAGIVLLLSFCFSSLAGQSKADSLVLEQATFASHLGSVLEGFSTPHLGQSIDYHSTREDCSKALIVRASTGEMAIEWETAPVLQTNIQKTVQFFLITGQSLAGYDFAASSPGFKVYANDHYLAHFQNALGENWSVEGEEGGGISFKGFYKDMHGDIFGYTLVTIPASWVLPNRPVTLRVVGDKASSQHWFMVFQCQDGLNWFKTKAMIEGWYNFQIEPEGDKMVIEMHAFGMDVKRRITLTTVNGFQLNLSPGVDRYQAHAKGSIPRKSWNGDSIAISSPDDPAFFMGPIELDQSNNGSLVQSDRIVQYQVLANNQIRVLQLQVKSSSIADDIFKVSSSVLANGSFHLLSSSHQDIAWMDSPEACVEDRDVLLITPALEKLIENPNYANDMEDILMLREYLSRHPEKKEEIGQLILSGRLSWGASYIQPYEEMFFGEPLIRQFYLGKKWYEKQFPGAQANIYWNVDVPGRTLQMPQILAKSGVDYMIISRHDQGLFNWQAPDGSKVLTYSPGHYYSSYTHLKNGFFETVRHLAQLSDFWKQYYSQGTSNPVMPILSDADMAVPDSYFDYIDDWNSLATEDHPLPKLFHSTAGRFMNEAVATGVDFPTIKGERPAVWLYIHGPSHFEALKYGRSAGRMLPAAEKMATFAAIVSNNWAEYPASSFEKAWESAIYPDHGWGGNKGDITDQTFYENFFEADSLAQLEMDVAIKTISRHIDHSSHEFPVEIFNTLDWVRNDPVEYELNDLPDRNLKNFVVTDTKGKPIPWQFIDAPTYYPSGFLKRARIVFIADQVPANGFSSVYIKSVKRMKTKRDVPDPQKADWENRYYHLLFDGGGMKLLYDKELQQEIWKTDQFRGGELFTMHSEGNGAGEFADIQQPDMAGFDRLMEHSVDWKLTKDGPVFSQFEGMTKFNHTDVQIVWKVYNQVKRIDISVHLIDWDGTPFREFRLAFPIDLDHPKIQYEVPFGMVEVGRDELQQAAGERYTTLCPEVHPRGIGNWISASDSQKGITLSSEVAVWDYINPTTLESDATLLQPILLASRKSCHGLGPLYHQKGSHSMHFSLFTHEPGWENGYKLALQANQALVAHRGSSRSMGRLPENYSFLQLDDPLVMTSTVKKADESGQMVLRVFDMEGKDKIVRVTTPWFIESCSQTDLLENRAEKVDHQSHGIQIRLGHHAIETRVLKIHKGDDQ